MTTATLPLPLAPLTSFYTQIRDLSCAEQVTASIYLSGALGQRWSA